MAEFPLAGHSETVSKVISSVLPPRSYAYLSAFLPGFYLEVSVCLANPKLLQQLIVSFNQAANFGRYPKILIAAFLAFILGNAFMLWTAFVNRIVAVLYWVNMFLWEQFFAGLVLSVLQNPRIARIPLIRRRWMQELVVRPISDAVYDIDSRSEGMRKLWATIAKGVFEKRYRVDIRSLKQEEWNALYEASRGLSLVPFSDHLQMIASQALGWSGLVAIWFAPALINRNYIGFNLFMIAIGILYQWRLTRGLNDGYTIGMFRVRALLGELRKGKYAAGLANGEQGRAEDEAPPDE